MLLVNHDDVVELFTGPYKEMTKYEATPWLILTAEKPVNVTLTFTPGKALQ